MTAPKSLPPLRFQPARDSAFRRELRERADAYLAASATHRFADWRMYGKAIALTSLAALLYVLALNAATVFGFVACYVASVVTAWASSAPALSPTPSPSSSTSAPAAVSISRMRPTISSKPAL